MSKFTPGPWEIYNSVQVFTKLGAVNASGIKADDTDGWMIADCAPVGAFVDGSIQEMPWQEQKANAALIADAPALLDALEELLKLLKPAQEFHASASVARALIAKHRGGV